MKQIILNEKHLKQLDAYFQELPMKYANQLVNFINELIKEQEKELIDDKKDI
jgi:hypothetical protein